MNYHGLRQPVDLLSLDFTTGGRLHFNIPGLDDLVTKMSEELNEKKAVELVQDAYRLVANESGSSIPVFISRLYGKRANVNGVQYMHSSQQGFHKTWLA